MFQRCVNEKTSKPTFRNRAVVIAGLTILMSSIWLSGQAADKSAPMSKHQHDGQSVGSMDMHMAMMKGMKEMDAMKSTGNTDYDFAAMMKKHHESALDMAEVELQNGKDAKMRSMAKRIIESQKKEIKEFDAWLAKHKQPMAAPMSKSK